VSSYDLGEAADLVLTSWAMGQSGSARRAEALPASAVPGIGFPKRTSWNGAPVPPDTSKLNTLPRSTHSARPDCDCRWNLFLLERHWTSATSSGCWKLPSTPTRFADTSVRSEALEDIVLNAVAG